MFLPVGDDQIQGGAKPIFSYSFLGLNVLLFLFQLSTGEGYNDFIRTFGSIPAEIKVGEDLFTLLTNMFLHADFMHLFGNMLFLWIFADNIEAVIGNVNFVVFYIMGGIIASLCHALSDFDSVTPAIGASGAIAACLGAYLVMFPKSKIKVLVIYMMNVFKVPALYFLGFWILKDLASVFGIIGGGGNVAYWAHIGGFAFGAIAGYFAKMAYPVDQHFQVLEPAMDPEDEFL